MTDVINAYLALYTSSSCWLSEVHGTIYAFIAPMLLILLVGLHDH